MLSVLAQAISIKSKYQQHLVHPGKEDKTLIQQMSDNSLFNEISGYKPTGGIIGNFLAFISDTVDKISGIGDDINDQMI